MAQDDVIALTSELMRLPSITPEDAGCQAVLKARLAPLGFVITDLPHQATQNFWAMRGNAKPVFVFAGHTDVVACGNIAQWKSPPFEPTLLEGRLYGRGVADMKGSVAAMVIATERFIAKHPNHAGAIAFLITSAEEGPSDQGTPVVLDYLTQIGQTMDYCLVGEPSSHDCLGDLIKNGRRGSLSGELTILGKQGHIAYPELADNPIHRALAALDALCQTSWDQGFDNFSPTSFQISNINGGTGSTNVTPGSLHVLFNFRYSPAVTHQQLQARFTALLADFGLQYTLTWTHWGFPYLTEGGGLIDATRAAIERHCGVVPQLSTHGGTSDGRYIAKYCPQVIEFGPTNRTIHQVNECVTVKELITLIDVYQTILEQLLVC